MFRQNSGFMAKVPPVTKNLVIINVLFWIASLALPKIGINLVELFGLHIPGASDFKFFQILTYMFMHDTSSFTHVFFNMFAVYMFGSVLEQVWGFKRFLIYYLITGLGAGLVQEAVWMFNLRDLFIGGFSSVNLNGMEIIDRSAFLNLYITIGASGSVFGILLAYGMLFPNVPLYLMFIPIPIKAKYFVVFYGLAELFMGVSNFGGDNVAHFAHLGGMLFGFILIKYWRKNQFKEHGRLF